MPRITIQATVPAGKKTGETFTAKTPSGTDVQVTVPKNAPPGAKLEIMVEETVKVTPNKETVNATPNPLKQPLGTPLELESQTQTPSIKNLPIAVAADEWERSGKLYGQPGTNGWFFGEFSRDDDFSDVVACYSSHCAPNLTPATGNFIYNQRNRHPALQPFFTPRIQCDSQREHEEKRTFLKMSFLMSFGIGLAIFSSFGAIDFYKAIDCACGCEEFTWPPTREAILNDPRYDESYWPVGQPMCYPIKGRKLDDTKATLNGKKWPLGPAYTKPVPLQWCDEADANCDCGNNCEFNKGDPLYLWSVSVDVVNGVIMGKPDHHCKEDDCYYVKRDVYENHLCEPCLEQGSEQYYWLFIVSELIQFVVSFLLLRARKESMESL